MNQKGGFTLGLVVGLLIGLVLALAVALYITKAPMPFIDKVPQRTAEQDQTEAARNRGWDPNAALGGAAAQRAASAATASRAASSVPAGAASAVGAAPAAPVPPVRDPAAILAGQSPAAAPKTALTPPSTASHWPVMCLPASLAKSKVRPFRSSSSPKRLSGACDAR